MGKYWLRRGALSLLGLIVALSAVFAAGRLIGDPVQLMLGPEASPADVTGMRDELGLNDPLHEQYFRFLGGAVRLDFGSTLRYGTASSLAGERASAGVPALPLVLDRMPATFFLAGMALLIAIPLGLLLGTLAAARPRSRTDQAVTLLSLASVSTVEFWAGLMLVLIFALGFGLFPTSGYGGLAFVVLPALTLALRPIGRITQITRGALADELAKPYVVAARARGIPESRVLSIHAMKNAALPIITLSGDELVALLTGVIIVETVFAWPGVGALLVDALTRRDLPLVEASMFVLASIAIGTNLLVDASYRFFDPKVRLR